MRKGEEEEATGREGGEHVGNTLADEVVEKGDTKGVS
jgi:hypothetical protein